MADTEENKKADRGNAVGFFCLKRAWLSLSRNDAVGRALPPHPSPLPQGEGGPSADSDWTNRWVNATAVIEEAKAASPLGSAAALYRVKLNRSGQGNGA